VRHENKCDTGTGSHNKCCAADCHTYVDDGSRRRRSRALDRHSGVGVDLRKLAARSPTRSLQIPGDLRRRHVGVTSLEVSRHAGVALPALRHRTLLRSPPLRLSIPWQAGVTSPNQVRMLLASTAAAYDTIEASWMESEGLLARRLSPTNHLLDVVAASLTLPPPFHFTLAMELCFYLALLGDTYTETASTATLCTDVVSSSDSPPVHTSSYSCCRSTLTLPVDRDDFFGSVSGVQVVTSPRTEAAASVSLPCLSVVLCFFVLTVGVNVSVCRQSAVSFVFSQSSRSIAVLRRFLGLLSHVLFRPSTLPPSPLLLPFLPPCSPALFLLHLLHLLHSKSVK